MSAADLARSIAPADLHRRPDSIDREVASLDPAYGAEVERLAQEYFGRVSRSRSDRLAALRAEDPAAAAVVRPSLRVLIGLIAAFVAGAGAYAFYFSRAQFGLESVTPIAMVFVLAAAAFYLLAALPIRRRPTPPSAVVASGVVLLLLTGAALGFGGYLVLSFAPAVSAWLLLGLASVGAIGVVALLVAIARAATPRAERTRSRASEAGFAGLLRDDALAHLEAATDAVTAAYTHLPASTRSAMEAEAAAARAVLRDRGLDATQGTPPGVIVVRARVELAAASIGVQKLLG